MADHSDDLDELLDSALDDFQTLNLASASQGGVNTVKKESVDIKQASTSKLAGGSVQGLGMGLPDLNNRKKTKQKPPQTQDSHISEALDKLREQTREAVRGLEAVAPPPQPDNFGTDAMMEDWVKQFEAMAGGQDMESMVEAMMQQLLSKDILHEPMKEIGERYPAWLVENKAKLTEAEYTRYSNQYTYIKDLNRVYETEPDNFNKIVELMQKMQECGQPPNDIVQELAPDFDISSLGQVSPEMLEGQQNCCIM